MVAALLALSAGLAQAANTYVYMGAITERSALIAWGTLGGPGNTIGRESTSMGKAEVKVGDRTLQADRNWIDVTGLKPDTSYDYEVQVKGQKIGSGTVRTYPEKANRLVFFVIGDFGTGSARQRLVADAMSKEFARRTASDNPVRFVLTVGDNIYSDLNMGYFVRNSGSEDRDWESKFFGPYRELIRHIPFYPTLGNHDGNGSENRADLSVYLDNFFFPGSKPARWYRFSFGGLADFFALDSSDNTDAGAPAPVYLEGSPEFTWMRGAIPASAAPWKIPYFHHPLFCAGPRHTGVTDLKHWEDLFAHSGVAVVFNGHEHNFQYSEVSDATRHIRWVISGAGGALRAGNPSRNMAATHMEGWAGQRHFLVVEIEGREMKITPVSYEKLVVRDRYGKPVPMPLVVNVH